MKNIKLKLKIRAKTYHAKTNRAGKAVFKIKLTKKGNLKAKLSFAGNRYYASLIKTVRIRVK
nr:hypothetical protein [uncultured Methanobrevibacter sp.]